MKQTTTPAIKYIDGQPFVRVVDLAHLWNTSTSSILATDKLYRIPEEHLRRINGSAWCSFDGLRYRLKATSRRGRLTVCIRKFLKQQEKAGAEKKQTRPVTSEPKPTAKTEPEPGATDLGTAARVHDLDVRVKALEHDVPHLLHAMCPKERVQELSRKLDNLADAIHDLQVKQTTADSETYAAKEKAANAVSASHASRNRARNNANRITRQAARLDKLDDRMAAMENDSYRRFDTVMTRCHHVETRQGGTAVQVTRLEQRQRFALWSLAVMATVQVFAAIIRLASR